ncbi:Tfp pilus assembly protein FimT/FimU [Deinococcus lacus]|uniref:Tfp pilus assembly protein FimT/FimU n=1 Tax=Deinococcus lacus TaxID=392561 RepID=A0ABW1YCR5_9DEIO
MRAGRISGVTLFELLIAIAVMGVLAAIGFNISLSSIRATQVREAANLVARDVREARSQAQRNSQNMTFAWSGNTYKVARQGREASVPFKSLPRGVTLECLTNCGNSTVSYTAPYGELANGLGSVLRVSMAGTNIEPIEIRIMGVTGKVMTVQGS